MEKIELSGYELYELSAMISGLRVGEDVKFLGFVNEKELTEGTKRFAARINKKLVDELEILNKQRNLIQSYTEENKSDDEIKAIKIKKDSELMNEKIIVEVEKLDFSKVENVKLSENYQFLYEKIFK